MEYSQKRLMWYGDYVKTCKHALKVLLFDAVGIWCDLLGSV